MGKGRGDDEDEVEVEGVDDAFEDAHQSDDEEYDANAIEEESDDEEDDMNVLSPSKIKLAKEEKKRLREQKKAQRTELEKMREQQNAAIAKGVARVHSPMRPDDTPSPPRLPVASICGDSLAPEKPRGGLGHERRRAQISRLPVETRARRGTTRARRDRVTRVSSRSRVSRAEPVDRRDRARAQHAVRPVSFSRLASAESAASLFRFAIADRRFFLH